MKTVEDLLSHFDIFKNNIINITKENTAIGSFKT